MGALEDFARIGVRLEIEDAGNLRAFGQLTESARLAIKARKPELITELQRREFESLLAIVGPAYNTPAHEYPEIRQAAASDLPAAILAYRTLAKLSEAKA